LLQYVAGSVVVTFGKLNTGKTNRAGCIVWIDVGQHLKCRLSLIHKASGETADCQGVQIRKLLIVHKIPKVVSLAANRVCHSFILIGSEGLSARRELT
jgi:hypothetical protein